MHNFAPSFSALLHKHCEKVTFGRKCNFLFLFHIVNIITKISAAEAYLILKGMEIIMANRINLNQTSYHGAGAIEEIANEAKAHGFKKAFVCSDPDLVKFHVTSKVTDILEKNGLAYELYSDIKPNPTIENVQHGVQAFKDSEADYLIAIGGGSSMDTSKAIELISKSLRGAVENTKEGREGMALGQYIAGMGFSNVGLGIAHSMAHTLGAVYDTPHGVACAMMLPIVMEYNQECTGEKYREIARAMGVKGVDEMSQDEYRKAAIEAVKKLSVDVGIPTKLEAIKEEDLQFLAESAHADACAPGNPKDASVEDLKELFRKIM